MSWVAIAVIGVVVGYLAAMVFGIVGDVVAGLWGRVEDEDEEEGEAPVRGLVVGAGLFAVWLGVGDAVAAYLGGYSAAVGGVVGAGAGAVGGLVTVGFMRRLWAMGPVLWIGPCAVANAVACWGAFGRPA